MVPLPNDTGPSQTNVCARVMMTSHTHTSERASVAFISTLLARAFTRQESLPYLYHALYYIIIRISNLFTWNYFEEVYCKCLQVRLFIVQWSIKRIKNRTACGASGRDPASCSTLYYSLYLRAICTLVRLYNLFLVYGPRWHNILVPVDKLRLCGITGGISRTCT